MIDKDPIETLRYFYSSIFQGFAALISFGIVIFTVYLQKIENQLSLIEQNVYTIFKVIGEAAFRQIFRRVNNDFYNYCKNTLTDHSYIDPRVFDEIQNSLNKYITLHDNRNAIIKEIKYPLISSSIVLLLSIIFLLTVDSLNTIILPYLLLLLIIWSFVEILYIIKFSLEFKIIYKSKLQLFNKLLNVFTWNNR